ncbi:MAG: hypothetical protein JNL28_03980 [Planctomycetes bacterium]|nr:hypothetical protein [Planctomycetota bacterium]
MRITRIKKRDGRELPFEKAKIQSAVERAQRAAGIDDEQAARDVADIVEMALTRRYFGEGRVVANAARAVPGIEEIQDLVEQALVELGHAAVAKTYILYRDRRAQIRAAEAEEAAHAVGADATRTARGPRVQVSGGLEAWRRSRIVAALMDETDLPRARAEEVALRVEERVFALGVKRLSTALIRELVDNELVELGLSQALRRHRPVGLPRHDLRRLLGTGRRDAARATAAQHEPSADVTARVAGEILRRFALEDVLTETAAEHHLSGEIHVEDLEYPHQALWSSIPCEHLLRGTPSVRAAFDMLDEVAEAARATSRGIVLEGGEALVAALAKSSRSGSLPAFLSALSAVACASGRRVDLHLAGHPSAALSALIEECAALEDEGRAQWGPRIFVDAADLLHSVEAPPAPTLSRAVETLLARGRLVPTWSSARRVCVGPGSPRTARERGVLHSGGAVALNLPRAARRAGPWREDALLENIALNVEAALDALVALRDFQRNSSTRTFERRGRVTYALTPVGLREALRWLCDGEVRSESAERVVAFVFEAAARFAAARGLDVVVTPYFGEAAAVRFASLDAELFHVAQPLLFEGAAPGASGARGGDPYSCGFELASADPGAASTALLPAQAGIARAIEYGAFHPPSLLAALSSPSAPQPALDALLRLERARSRPRTGTHALYALPPLLGEHDDPDSNHAAPVAAHAHASQGLYSDPDPSRSGLS